MRVLLLLTLIFLMPALANAQELSAQGAQDLAAEDAVLLIDVRHPQEWRQTGVPRGAQTVSIHDPGGLPAFLAKVRALADQSPDQPIALICATGVRSSFAANLLREEGYDQVFDVSEGMLGSSAGAGWLKQDLPVRSCREC